MTEPRFQKKIENFVCEHCGSKVTGSGYTNHCPNCLYSKHVDINPGDRAEACGGIMPPVDFEIVKGEYILIHKCKKCGIVRKNHLAKNDNLEALIKLSKSIAKNLLI
jgi:ribosomal protein L37AE/L43A